MMTFFASVWIEGEWKYSVSEVVTTLAFISLLRRPLTGMPQALASFAEVSLPDANSRSGDNRVCVFSCLLGVTPDCNYPCLFLLFFLRLFRALFLCVA